MEKTLEQLLADALKTIAKPMLEEQARLVARVEQLERQVQAMQAQ